MYKNDTLIDKIILTVSLFAVIPLIWLLMALQGTFRHNRRGQYHPVFFIVLKALYSIMTNWQSAKHQTRFRRFSQKMRSLSFIEWCLTKPVHPCKGLTDESHLVYLHPSTQCLQGLGHSPVTSRARAIKKGFTGSIVLERLKKCLFSHFLNPQNHL